MDLLREIKIKQVDLIMIASDVFAAIILLIVIIICGRFPDGIIIVYLAFIGATYSLSSFVKKRCCKPKIE